MHRAELPHARRDSCIRSRSARSWPTAGARASSLGRPRPSRGGTEHIPVVEPQAFPTEGRLDLPGRPLPVLTPGHTDGHCAYHLPDAGILITGDALVSGHPTSRRRGAQLLPRMFHRDRARALDSLTVLEELDADVLPPRTRPGAAQHRHSRGGTRARTGRLGSVPTLRAGSGRGVGCRAPQGGGRPRTGRARARPGTRRGAVPDVAGPAGSSQGSWPEPPARRAGRAPGPRGGRRPASSRPGAPAPQGRGPPAGASWDAPVEHAPPALRDGGHLSAAHLGRRPRAAPGLDSRRPRRSRRPPRAPGRDEERGQRGGEAEQGQQTEAVREPEA